MNMAFCRDNEDIYKYLQDGIYIYPRNDYGEQPRWHSQQKFQGSVSAAELSQNDTEPSMNTSAAYFGQSLLSSNSLTGLAAEAQYVWESSCRAPEPWSNCSSVCSSASTLASAASCAVPPLSYAPAYAPAPSFDFTRTRTQTHAHEYIDTHAAHRPCELGSLSVGPGVAATPPMAWQWASALQAAAAREAVAAREAGAMDGIEEFSLGPGCPC